ncbi:MAG: hypothetical protein Q9Q40_14660 [Acidobacteriota bacterium]|nr:hypothetical protein [Acidobacteriota bacterium]MDQ7086468.1 hypothetical protein [Acidobacteriota bacterium]
MLSRYWLPCLATFAIVTACAGGGDLAPPSREEIYSLFHLLLCQEDRPPADELPLAVWVLPPDKPSYYRPADAAERAALFLPPPLADIEVGGLRQRRYPAWRVELFALEKGRRGATFLADVVRLDGELAAIMHWRPALKTEDGARLPDFRPHPGRGEDVSGAVAVVVFPPWAVTPR